MSADGSRQLATHVVSVLKHSEHTAYLAGGCVRDLLLDVKPKDFDVATSATPPELLALFPDALQVGAHFGVVLLKREDAQVEIATFRSDHDYQDGRRPGHVQFETDPRQDVLRRDFTINALLMDPESGEIFDYVHGREDLADKVIRAIGDPARRFAEDHLRLLRAVRFAARLGFRIEEETLQAIQREHASILRISMERIRDELSRILTEGGAKRGFELLDETGLLGDLLPEVAAMKGVEQPPEYHPEGDVWIHTLLLLQQFDELEERPITLALSALLHDVGKPPTFERAPDRIRFSNHAQVGAEMTCEILTRLKYPNDIINQVEALVANHMRFGDAHAMRESTLKRFLRLPSFDEHLALHRMDCNACHGILGAYNYVQAKREQFSHEHLRPPRLVGGRDLIRAGYQPGPRFTEILNAVEDAQLEGEVSTGAEAMDWVRERYPLEESA